MSKKVKKQFDDIRQISYIDNKFNEFVFKKEFGYVDLVRRMRIAEKAAFDKKLEDSLNESNKVSALNAFAGGSGGTGGGGGASGGY